MAFESSSQIASSATLHLDPSLQLSELFSLSQGVRFEVLSRRQGLGRCGRRVSSEQAYGSALILIYDFHDEAFVVGVVVSLAGVVRAGEAVIHRCLEGAESITVPEAAIVPL